MQDTLLAVMEREHITGFWTKPAKARMKKTGERLPISQMYVSGWGGVVPPESGVHRDEYCSGCQYSHYSPLTASKWLIDPRAWDGSDFFKIWPLMGFVFVSSRVRQIFKQNRFRGPQFLKTFPNGTGLGYSPQRLSQTFPEQRAHEIGDSLGIY